MAGRKHSASLVKMKRSPRWVPYPMSLRSLARCLVEWWATLSRSPVGTRRLRRSDNKKRQIPPVIAHAHRGLSDEIGHPGVAVCLLPGTELAFDSEVQFDR